MEDESQRFYLTCDACGGLNAVCEYCMKKCFFLSSIMRKLKKYDGNYLRWRDR